MLFARGWGVAWLFCNSKVELLKLNLPSFKIVKYSLFTHTVLLHNIDIYSVHQFLNAVYVIMRHLISSLHRGGSYLASRLRCIGQFT